MHIWIFIRLFIHYIHSYHHINNFWKAQRTFLLRVWKHSPTHHTSHTRVDRKISKQNIFFLSIPEIKKTSTKYKHNTIRKFPHPIASHHGLPAQAHTWEAYTLSHMAGAHETGPHIHPSDNPYSTPPAPPPLHRHFHWLLTDTLNHIFIQAHIYSECILHQNSKFKSHNDKFIACLSHIW